ncbi:hypothetical protein [Nitrosomonas sp. Is37]|uniref:hypothetical protein n=1 Tax=Nitrosomonas sp. Is37 TaxID=3080535 RepID=UPI00294B30E7|nr:hypothetical protein [Nitrosomonas sp. Is37]MDV6343973.1 hypothetical protein [Nitrosomonas sp. Is37]
MNPTLENALLDVRKAYRLLADYQQRLIELLALIREELGASSYYQCYRNSPPRGFERLERSNDAGWRFLSMSDVSVLWIRDGGQEDPIHFHKTGDLLIDVVIRSDTGNGRHENNYALVEESSSELWIYFFLCKTPQNKSHNWYQKVWDRTRYPQLNKAEVCENNPGYYMYGESLQLSDLSNESAVKQAIKTLRERASANLEYKI